MRVVCFIHLKRLLVFAFCFCLGGCGWMDDFVFSDLGTGLGRGFEGMAKMGKNLESVAEAATAAARPIGHLKKSMDSLGELATGIGSIPLPGRAPVRGETGRQSEEQADALRGAGQGCASEEGRTRTGGAE